MAGAGKVAVLAAAALLSAAPVAAAAPRGLAVEVEGGVNRYTGALGSRLNSGGTWALRVESRLRPWLSLGLAYQGSANRLSLGYEDGTAPWLRRDAGDALVRLYKGEQLFEPFVELGLGVARLGISRGTASSEYQRSVGLEIPAAAGVALRAGALRVGMKVGYNLLLGKKVYAGERSDLVVGALTLGANL